MARAHDARSFKLPDPRVAFILLRREKLDMHNFGSTMICRGYRVAGVRMVRGGHVRSGYVGITSYYNLDYTI